MLDLPRLHTDRVLLRVPTSSDASAMLSFVADNRKHFAPWEPSKSIDFFTPGYWQARLDRELQLVRAGRGLSMVLIRIGDPEGRIIGQSTLSNIIRGPLQAAFLGYAIDRRLEGHGYMREALQAVIGHAFGTMNLHRLMANYVPENERSGRLLKRLGFVEEGLARDYLRLDGAWHDHVLTALVNPAWVESTNG